MPMSSRRRLQRRERLRSGGAADVSGSLHRPLRSERGRGRVRGRGRGVVMGDADRVSESLSELFISDPHISLRKRAHSQSHLRRRGGGRKAVALPAVPEGSPSTTSEEGSTSKDFSPPVSVIPKPKEAAKECNKSSSPLSEPSKDGVFDPVADGVIDPVAEYDQATEPSAEYGPTEPFAPWCNGTLVELECNVCERVGHLDSACPYLFHYPDDNPHFDREYYDIVCVCGDEIVPGSRNCVDCPPNCGVKLSPKYLPRINPTYQNPEPDPVEFIKLSQTYKNSPDSLKQLFPWIQEDC